MRSKRELPRNPERKRGAFHRALDDEGDEAERTEAHEEQVPIIGRAPAMGRVESTAAQTRKCTPPGWLGGEGVSFLGEHADSKQGRERKACEEDASRARAWRRGGAVGLRWPLPRGAGRGVRSS